MVKYFFLLVLMVAIVATPGFLAGQDAHHEGDGHDPSAHEGHDHGGEGTAATETSAKTGSGLASFFPDGLLTNDQQAAEASVLDGKIVGFYFSAHWCPPCRQFSPKLVEFRNKHKDEFEVVFVSSDKNEAAQFKYMDEVKMEWFTMAHGSPAAKALSEKYGIQSIPTLVVVGPDGNTITKDGRGDVSSNPDGSLAKWKSMIK